MVLLRTDPGTRDSVFTIGPNCSLSWPRMKRAFGVLCLCLLGIAVYFSAKGAWLIAPFAGLEILVLGAGMYLSSCRGATREIVSIQKNTITVYRGRNTLRETATYPRPWAKVHLVRDPRGWYPGKLLIGAHGRTIEIGSDLIEAEREQLAEDLKKIICAQPACKPAAAVGRLSVLDTAEQHV